MHEKLDERQRVALEIIEGLGGRASFDLIETMIRAQYRKHLRQTLMSLADQGLLNRFIPGPYEITHHGRAMLREHANAASSALH